MKQSRSSSKVEIDKQERQKQFMNLRIFFVQQGEKLSMVEVCNRAWTTHPTYQRALREGYIGMTTYEKLADAKLIDIVKILKKEDEK